MLVRLLQMFTILAAFSGPAMAKEDPNDANALLRVVVRDEANKGIGGASVKISGPANRTMRGTDGNGYTEENPPKGRYNIEVSASGYASQSQEINLREVTTISFALISDKDKTRDASGNVNALLRIRVLDGQSKPLGDVQIRLKVNSQATSSHKTDGNGYTEVNAPKKEYEVEASKDGYDDAYLNVNLNKQMTIIMNLKKLGEGEAKSNTNPYVTTPPPEPQPTIEPSGEAAR